MQRNPMRLLNDNLTEALNNYEKLREDRSTTRREFDEAWCRIREIEKLRSDLYNLYRNS